jgi:hypothetical protein
LFDPRPSAADCQHAHWLQHKPVACKAICSRKLAVTQFFKATAKEAEAPAGALALVGNRSNRLTGTAAELAQFYTASLALAPLVCSEIKWLLVC